MQAEAGRAIDRGAVGGLVKGDGMTKGMIEKLKATGACHDAVKWTSEQPSAKAAWETCERGDWMLWILGRQAGPAWGKKRKPLVLAACECARLALPYTKDARVLTCIETAEAWARGLATPEQVRAAAAAARKKILKKCAAIVRKHYPKAPCL